MLFNTFQFAIFLAVVVLLYRAAPRGVRNQVLLGASLVFYTLWIPAYLPLLLLGIGVNHALLRGMRASRRPQLFLLASIVFTMGLLVYFKYAAMLVETLVPGWELLTGVTLPIPEILLTLGISFYSFQIVAYSVDCYWSPKTEIPSLTRYALFIAFFPQLIAGPILRGGEFLPQAEANRGPSPAQVRRGLWLLASGVVKKVILADFLLAPFVDPIFSAPGVASAPFHWVAIYSFCFQIYFDFSGYTDMGRGMALLFGFELPFNFEEPYLARNPAEFWRRWHMTLTRWLTYYIFTPLGGATQGEWLTYRNLILTMLLAGLWHGAGWNFVVWGGMIGLMLAAHRRFGSPERVDARLVPGDAWKILLHFNVYAVVLVLFRVDSLPQAADFWTGLCGGGEVSGWPVMQTAILLLCVASHIGERLLRPRLAGVQAWCGRSLLGVGVEGAALGLILAIAVLVAGAGGEFIYFQF